MNEQENTKLAARMYETFMAGDIEGFLNLFSDDASWHAPEIENVPLNGKFSGRENLAKFISGIDNYEEFLKFDPTEYIAQGDRVVILGSFVARSKTTDKQYATDFAHIIAVKDGKITSFYEFFDNAAAGRAHAAANAA
ncbi:MAG TPA: nuclear transport factor 2 family protein [Pyrinomonadaceae bacterium]|nr:nuclear transport factor 2 family protein [Pyrinomonadaceae bacterium]